MAFLQQHEEQAKEGKRWKVIDLGPGSAGQGVRVLGSQWLKEYTMGSRLEGGVKPEER